MRVSIIIPTYNRLRQLQRVLAGLEHQTFPRGEFEVLVVSDGSTDGTDEYLRAATPSFKLRPLFQTNQGAAAARNLGVAQAAGEILLFIDDDVFPVPELIEEHLSFHTAFGDHAVVIGPMLAPPAFKMSPWVRWETNRLAEQYQDMEAGKWAPTPRQFYTGNSSIARRHLIEANGFDVSFRRAEDVELAYRLDKRGLKFFFNPRAAGYHYAERSLIGWLATPYAYGRNDVIFARQRGQTWLLPTLLKEYHQRNAFVHLLIQVCLSRPTLSKGALNLFKQVAIFGEALHLGPISNYACSAMFHLRYYEGMTEQLGGRQAFFQSASKAQLAG